MAGVFNEADDTDGLDLIEQVEANGGEYEVVPDEAFQGNEPSGDPSTSGDTDNTGDTGDTGDRGQRPRNPDGTFAPRTRQEAQEQQQNRVPISAIQEERRKRQELERRLNEREREWAAVQERVRIFQEQQQQEAARRAEQERIAREQAAMPNRDEDPLGYAQYMIERQQREIETLRQAQQAAYGDFQRQQAFQSQAAVLQEIGQQVQSLQTEFTLRNPDYPDAFAHLAQTRYNELAMMGYNDQQIPQILEQERTMIVTGCLEPDPITGRHKFRDNPARVAYELAKARGWSGPQPQNGTWQAPAEAPVQQQPMPQQNPNHARVQQMQQRVNQASRFEGRNPTEAPLSLESIAKMDENEWRRMMETDPDLVDALMGGR